MDPSAVGLGSPITASPRDEHFPLLTEDRGAIKVIRNFTPSWFSVCMGTGIVSILLHNLPYNGAWLYWLSVIVFALNVVLFTVFCVITILRYILYPQLWKAMLLHPAQSLFIGTFPMALATIVNLMVLICVPAWGEWVLTFAWTLWIIDAVISIAICCYLPFLIMHVHETQLSTMTAAWLLPIVTTIVAAASGGIVAGSLTNAQHALGTLVASYILWGTGVPLAMATLVIYFHRLTVHKLPPREVMVSVFLPLGPLGQGAYGIMQLGKVAMKIMPKTHTLVASAGETFYTVGFLVAIIMWGFGLVWFFFALASISRSKFPFNMGWWGFVFPLGVYTSATLSFGQELPSRFFDILGNIFTVAVVLLWVVVSVTTVRKALTGEIFFSPCLEKLRRIQLEEKQRLRQQQA
ncbi:hypothetical protein L228DRAFT_224815, partial [Xylona heveae TC161]